MLVYCAMESKTMSIFDYKVGFKGKDEKISALG